MTQQCQGHDLLSTVTRKALRSPRPELQCSLVFARRGAPRGRTGDQCSTVPSAAQVRGSPPWAKGRIITHWAFCTCYKSPSQLGGQGGDAPS